MQAPWGSGDCSGRNTLTPALSQRERGPIFVALKREFDSILQVGGEFQSNAVSSPSLREWEREPIFVALKREFDSILQVGGEFQSNAVSSLSLWERAGVRGF
ncbi:hypothetical protein ASG55_14380 [Pseudomonas sp. Leaf434]|nr:hypothetical protein ASG55_14380 [Pseudomonas sp. Leaf434]